MSEYVAIIGSRNWTYLQAINDYIHQLPRDTVVISGGAEGVDKVAIGAAIALKMKTIVIPAQWETWGKQTGHMRNRHIVHYADRIVAFWDGKSKGTALTIDIANNNYVPVKVYRPRDFQGES